MIASILECEEQTSPYFSAHPCSKRLNLKKKKFFSKIFFVAYFDKNRSDFALFYESRS
jgi:hypothetical protein